MAADGEARDGDVGGWDAELQGGIVSQLDVLLFFGLYCLFLGRVVHACGGAGF